MIVGMTGVGGGSLMTPALIFTLGISPAVAVGTDLAFAGATKSVGVWKHRAAGNVDWRTMRLLAMGSLPATAVSILLLDRLRSREFLDAAVLPVLGVALLLTAAALILKTGSSEWPRGWPSGRENPRIIGLSCRGRSWAVW